MIQSEFIYYVKSNIGNRTDKSDDIIQAVDQAHMSVLYEAYTNQQTVHILRRMKRFELLPSVANYPMCDCYKIEAVTLYSSDTVRDIIETVPMQISWRDSVHMPHQCAKPTKVAFYNEELYFDKCPCQVYTVEVLYIKKPALVREMTPSELTGFEDVIIGFATASLYKTLGRYEDADYWYKTTRVNLIRKLSADQRQPNWRPVARPFESSQSNIQSQIDVPFCMKI